MNRLLVSLVLVSLAPWVGGSGSRIVGGWPFRDRFGRELARGRMAAPPQAGQQHHRLPHVQQRGRHGAGAKR